MLEEGRRDSGLAVPSASEIYGPAPTGVGTQHLASPYPYYKNRVVNLAITLNKQQQQVGSTWRPHNSTSVVNLATTQPSYLGVCPTTSFTGALPSHCLQGYMPLAAKLYL